MVSNGQKAEATVLNNAFISKTVDSTTTGVLTLNAPGSGAAVANTQLAINNDVAALAAHLSDASDAHDASSISNVPAGNLAATDVQTALDELQTDVDTRTTAAQAATIADTQIATARGAANGIAPLDASSKVPSAYLPSYVDDVLEFADFASFPVTGETGKIYVALDTNLIYRWSGTIYVNIASGSVVSVNGYTGAVTLVKGDIGLGNVDNTSDATKDAAATTLTNKTITAPIISSIVNTGTLTLPTSTDTLVGRATTDALTNKDFDGGTASNTRRLTVPKDTKANLDALTRKQATIVYATDQSKLYADDGSTLVEIGSGGGSAFINPTVQRFLSGSGTYEKNYAFTISSGSATVGATYTNNGVTFTVYATVASATLVYMNGNNVPLASGTLTRTSGTGDATITFTSFKAPSYLIIETIGGGGSSQGSGTGGGAGTAGDATTFGASFISAGGGNGGAVSAPGGAGGVSVVTIGSTGASILVSMNGNGGEGASGSGAEAAGNAGHQGGAGPFGGQAASTSFAAASDAIANSGAGGCGAGIGVVSTGTSSGGGAGAYSKVLQPNPSLTYAFVIAASKAGGTAGTNGFASGASGSGQIIVTENF